jgi:3-phenylpropionate/trans-cinnamate dioxygenase ferredoxin subunit
MSFVRVTSKSELVPGTMKDVEVNSIQILLVNLDDNYFAIGNICKHKGCKLSMGTLTGEVVQCPCHGSRYNVRTGEIVRGPTTEPEPSYEVKIENDQILVKV